VERRERHGEADNRAVRVRHDAAPGRPPRLAVQQREVSALTSGMTRGTSGASGTTGCSRRTSRPLPACKGSIVVGHRGVEYPRGGPPRRRSASTLFTRRPRAAAGMSPGRIQRVAST